MKLFILLVLLGFLMVFSGGCAIIEQEKTAFFSRLIEITEKKSVACSESIENRQEYKILNNEFILGKDVKKKLFNKISNDNYITLQKTYDINVLSDLSRQCLLVDIKNLEIIDKNISNIVSEYNNEISINIHKLISQQITIGEYNKLTIYTHIKNKNIYDNYMDNVVFKLSLPYFKSIFRDYEYEQNMQDYFYQQHKLISQQQYSQ